MIKISMLKNIFKKYLKKIKGIEVTPQLFLLVLIFLIVSFPHIQSLVKNYSAYLDRQKETKEQNLFQIELNKRTEALKIEGDRRLNMLSKYNINALKINSSTSPLSILIPNEIFSYMLGEFKDKKYGSNIQCRLSEKDKYVKYCPERILGICPLDDRYKFSLSDPQSTASPSPYELLNTKLKELGYRGTQLYFDKCERLNYQPIYREFEKEVPSIRKMIEENANDDFIKKFINDSFNNYLILKNN